MSKIRKSRYGVPVRSSLLQDLIAPTCFPIDLGNCHQI
uniref:Uncharacterized protein n=1 Tax=Anguilla anguilla TaxID=7936 RepID=A0A0E9TBA7_ANGAN